MISSVRLFKRDISKMLKTLVHQLRQWESKQVEMLLTGLLTN
jgi:hypothetical protein